MKIAVCAIARLENNYIREWVEHYKKIGFDKIFLYDNNLPEEEKLNEPIQDYVDSGYVDVIDVRKNQTCQGTSYNECYNLHSNEYDWIAFFDIDEFLIIEDNKNIKDILPLYTNFDNICVFYNTYDDNDLIYVKNNNYSLLNRFTRKLVNENNGIRKSIIKTKLTNPCIGAHGAKNKLLKYCNSNAQPIIVDDYGVQNKEFISYYNMKLNHYRLKTIEEFILNRIKKGDGCKINGKNSHPEWFTLDTFFKTNKWTQEKEEYANKLIKELNINN